MQILRVYAVLAAISFLLHIAWERLHIVLYTGYEALEGVLPVFLLATLGDVMYTLLAATAFALVKRDLTWVRRAGMGDYAVLALLGFFIAIFVEYKAMLLGRWAYTDAMPLIYGFGLSPLLQMTVLLPLTVYITTVVLRWLNR
jgi:hypothetical protein